MAFNNTSIGKFLTENKEKLIIGALIALTIGLTMGLCSAKHKNKTLRNNISALADTLSTYTLENGQLITAKQACQAKLSDMENLLGLKDNTIAQLENLLEAYTENAVNVTYTIQYDTIYITRPDSISIAQTLDSIYHWSYANNYLSMNGWTMTAPRFLQHIEYITVNADLTVGWTDSNKAWCTSNNPHLNITSVTAVKREPSAPGGVLSNFSWGIQLGVGPVYSLGNGIGLGFYSGIGLEYSF